MSQEEINKTEEQIEETNNQTDTAEKSPTDDKPKKRFFKRRYFLIAFGLLSLLTFFLVSSVFVAYRSGYIDNYIKGQFVTAFDEMGVSFSADKFQVSVNPLQMTLENATFNNKKTGEKIARIGNAKFNMTVLDLYALNLQRNVDIRSTDINDLEVWVKIKEDGTTNLEGIEILPPKNAVRFQYSSAELAIRDSVIHFGDLERKISGDAKNIAFFLEPQDKSVPDDKKRYKFDLTSTKSNFKYDESEVENIDVQADGILDQKGAEIANLKLTTPIGNSTLSGKIEDWDSPKYNLKIKSTVDLTQTSDIFPLGTAIVGVGNFEGKVTGQGEDYKVEGEVNSDALAASNIRLKALKINGTVDGDSEIYKGQGRAVAELLTFEDFKIDFPQLVGNIRGTGTDFKWFGELQAAGLKSPLGSIAGLYINDAVAEYRDKNLIATLGNVRAKRFFSDAVYLETIKTGNVKITSSNGTTNASIPNITANKLDVEGATLKGVNVSNVKVKNRNGQTDVQAGDVRVNNVETADARLKNVTAKGVNVQNRGGNTDITAQNIRSENVDTDAAKVGSVNATGVDIQVIGDETKIYSNGLQVAKVETDAATLGSLNIAGVRLSIRNGRIEAQSNDFNAGDVTLAKNESLPEGGKLQNVSVAKPVFVLEPSGRYRASLDMSLGGGTLGSVKLGKAKASVIAENEQVALNNLTADVMDGKIDGDATIALNDSRRSDIKADFENLDIGKLLALQGGRVIPVEGKTNGKVNLSFNGTNFRRASGNLLADINANAGTSERGFIPLTGKVSATATNGLFDLDYANLNTEKSSLNATGSFDLGGDNSNLTVALNSNDASEIERIVRTINVSPELEQQLDKYQVDLARNFTFNGNITGNISNPIIDGSASLDSLILRNRDLGTLVTKVYVSPTKIELSEGILQERSGGSVAFNVDIPMTGANNIAVNAKLNNVNTGNLVSALPVDTLPDSIRDLQAQTSGTVNLVGLPNKMQGEANITAKDGSVNGQSFDNLEAKAIFNDTLVNVEKFDAKFGEGFLSANGTYETNTTAFNFDAEGKEIPISRLRTLLPKNTRESLSEIDGIISLNAKAQGQGSESSTYDINFNGVGNQIVYKNNSLGKIDFKGVTEKQILKADLTTNFRGQKQLITANVNFADENLPFRAEAILNNTQLEPYISVFREDNPDRVEISGNATGRVFIGGNLTKLDSEGKRVFTSENLSGAGNLSQLALQIDETPLIATQPVNINFDMNEIVVDNAKFSGGGSNVVVNGVKALTDNGINNLAVDGKINLRILNALSRNVFFSGIADVAIRLTGVNKTSRLNGVSQIERGSVSTFVSSERLTLERIKGNLRFTTNQVQIDQVTGFLGGGRVNLTGGASLTNTLRLDRLRLEVRGNNVTAPLPKDFVTTGNANIEINGRRENDKFSTYVSGTFLTKRSLYTKEIDLANLISSRRDANLSQGTTDDDSILGDIQLDIRIIGRDAFVVRNNLADMTASADLRVTGNAEFPQISGRISANKGTLFFRDDRYDILRGTLTFPPNTTEIDPIINLQAESEINGYQIFVNLNGKILESESLNATLRSNPSLPQADVVSLVTTGSLANTGTGIPTYAQGGINTAAEILTDQIINKPIARATDKLFGLNKFKLDPIISGQRSNPTARLTVGRQINRNLLVTYSTNLSEDQNQVLALEYRVSNRLSFVAQYEQRSLSNVTQRRNNFSFEVRLRKRF